MDNGENDKRMKVALATNLDPLLIKKVVERDATRTITSVFGRLANDVFGLDKDAVERQRLGLKDLRDYIRLCHENQLEFSYLLNPGCIDNKDVESRSHRKIIKLLRYLKGIGTNSVIINSPYLCELIKNQFPRLKVIVGQCAYVTTLQQLKYWHELGADEVTVHQSLNRNFALLEDLLMYSRRHNVGLRLVANHTCLHGCPRRVSHNAAIAHADQGGGGSPGAGIDFNLISCNYQRIKNPVRMISSTWIRPEDVERYEVLSREAENCNLSIELGDWYESTEFLSTVLKAYVERSYNGNLVDILGVHRSASSHEVRSFKRGGSSAPRLNPKDGVESVESLFLLPDVIIDNKRLDGFIERFRSSYDCARRICDDGGWVDAGGDEGDGEQVCSYCRTWAKKAISYDKAEVEGWLGRAERVVDGLREGGLFVDPSR